jgi:hypothetical protein
LYLTLLYRLDVQVMTVPKSELDCAKKKKQGGKRTARQLPAASVAGPATGTIEEPAPDSLATAGAGTSGTGLTADLAVVSA